MAGMTLALDFPQCGQSPLGRLDPRWKLAALMPAAFSTTLLQTLPTALTAWVLSLVLAHFGELPRRWLFTRLGSVALILSFFLAWLPFVVPGDGTRLDLGLVTLSSAGLTLAVIILLKALTVVALMLALLASAPLQDTFKAAHALRVPGILVHLVLLTYRFVFLAAEEFTRLRMALRVRGFRNRADLHSYRTIGQVAGTLLVRSHERAERVGQAMRCRGFDGCYRSLHEFRTCWGDVAAFGMIVGLCRGLPGVGHSGASMNMPNEAAIKVTGLTFAYPGGKAALNQIHITVNPGETIGLVGPNGAGKTTLFLCLAGVLPIQSEQVLLAGLDPGIRSDRAKLPAHVGIVFQNSDDQLFSTSVGDDVAFGPLNLGLGNEEVRGRVTEALSRVGLPGFEERVPHHLSGGEKRRAALAGVLAMRPEILLLDEPSMFLDPRGRRELMALLKNLGGTQIIGAHDLDMILDLCQRVLLLDRGQLIADDLATKVLADQSLMENHGLEVPYRLRK